MTIQTKRLVTPSVVLLLLALAACGPTAAPVPPEVGASVPASGATDIGRDARITATFTRDMEAASLNASTFTLSRGTTAVQGTVSYADRVATFLPSAQLEAETDYTAVITTGAKDLDGLALASPRSWVFRTRAGAANTPTVVANVPLNAALDVAVNAAITVTFSEPMEAALLTTSTFTLTSGQPAVAVAGRVSYAARKATFVPAARLTANTLFTATLTTGAKSAAGVALAANHVFVFTTGTTVAPLLPVTLGAAGNFVILAKTGISTVPTSAITGDLGVSPAAASYITGFSLIADSTNVFATAPQVTGKVYASDYAPPTPSNMTTSISDMLLAFADASGRAADFNELGAGNIGGMTLAPGVYKWGTALILPTDVTLNGSATDVWIFQIAQDLTLSSGVQVRLTGGALAKNVFWQVAGFVELGTTSHAEGVVLCQTSITLRTGASFTGRLLAQTAVTLDGNTVVQPAN